MTQHPHNAEENFNKESPPEYETTDFYLASFLKSTGYLLAGLGKSGNRTIFKFGDKPERNSDILAYYNGEGSVPPLSLISAIKEMKALIHNIG
ncbi:MAG: DUF5659 domain-containing protein [Candidatus Aegiribacteria sp.]|nr:DUF5659 domain-containing protein [Candidatus Aegiribacteria sp.]